MHVVRFDRRLSWTEFGLIILLSISFSHNAEARQASVVDHLIDEANNGFRNREGVGTRPGAEVGAEGGVTRLRPDGSGPSIRRFAEPPSSSETAADNAGISENIKALAERISKRRDDLISTLKKAATPEAEEAAAKELRIALGGSADGKSLTPEALAKMVDSLKRPVPPETKETAATTLTKALSPDGLGKLLTPRVLHDDVEKLKKAATQESREPLAKQIVKTLGPDGINLFKRNGVLDTEAMAAALGLDRTTDAAALASLGNELRAPVPSLLPAPLGVGTPGAPNPVPLVAGPLKGDNPPTPTPTPDPNVKLGDPNLLDDGKGLFDGVNEDALANANENDLNKDRDEEERRRREQEEQDRRDREDRDRENKNKNNKDKGLGNKGEGQESQPPQPLTPGPLPERAKQIENKVPEMPKLDKFQNFEAPKAGEETKLDSIVQALMGGAGKSEPNKAGGDKIQEILDAGMLSFKSSLSLLEMKGVAQKAMIERVGQSRTALAPGGYRNVGQGGGGSFAGRSQNMNRSNGGPRVARTGGAGNSPTANGPALAGSRTGGSTPQSLRTFMRPGKKSEGISRAATGRRRPPR